MKITKLDNTETALFGCADTELTSENNLLIFKANLEENIFNSLTGIEIPLNIKYQCDSIAALG
jgi:hypothetical protein